MPIKKKPAKPAAKKAVKPAAKKVSKPAPKKPAKPVAKKAAPAPAKKPTKPAAAAKTSKVVPSKTAKPAEKKPAKTAVVSKTAKPTAKPAIKQASAVKPATKSAPAVKPVAKTAPVKSAVKAVSAPAVKAALVKQAPAKPAATPVKTIEPSGIKLPVKKAIKELKKEAKTRPVEMKPIKTSVSTSIRYEPDFTKSVLDKKPVMKEEGPMVRYSDTELQEFKDLIQRKLEAAKKELVFLQGLITRKDEVGGDDGDGRYMTMEDGSVSMEREQLNQRASRQITYISHLEKALMRIENKTYGICRVTGKLIDKARLRAVPHATLSMEAKTGQVKSSGE